MAGAVSAALRAAHHGVRHRTRNVQEWDEAVKAHGGQQAFIKNALGFGEITEAVRQCCPGATEFSARARAALRCIHRQMNE